MVYPGFYGLNAYWLLLMLVSVVLGGITQAYIRSTYGKWSRVPLSSGLTGAQVAARVLTANGLPELRIQPVGGSLTDNYDPRSKVLNLSEGVYSESSVAAAGVAAHEAGHAVQDAKGYVWGAVRSSLVPAARFGSGAAWWFIILGLVFFRATQFGYALVWLGVVVFAAAVLFQVVTLPVEFDASRRAMATLESTGTLDSVQLAGARQVLTAAALTYVAATLVAALQLLYFIGLARRD